MDEEHLAVLLITANVGSIFEEPEQMFKPWLKEFLGCIERLEPCFVALHCQEVGGKNYETSMQHVNQFVKTILASEELVKYDRARVFLDEDYTAADKFTALGNLYFVHDTVEEVNIFDFVENKFVPVEGREVLSGNIENIQIKEKAKFPQHFFPEVSEKGYFQRCGTRAGWLKIQQIIPPALQYRYRRQWPKEALLGLLASAKTRRYRQITSPSIYNGNRQQALMHTLKRFEGDQYEKVPMLIFGDFNFRLDTNVLIKALTAKTTSEQTLGKKDQISKIVYTEEGNEKVVLTVEAKGFDYHDKHEDLFFNTIKWLKQYDTEMTPFKDRLSEYEINFPPSYPFSEDVNDGTSYMKTRCPSWCDRILISQRQRHHLPGELQHQNMSFPGFLNRMVDEKFHRPQYSLIGKEVCMGDHKPVYLSLHLKPGKGNLNESRSSSTKSPRKKVLSINGEHFESDDITDINIHDYAVFEKENDLVPEFRTSIRTRTESGTLIPDSLEPVPTKVRRKSFQEIAMQVRTCQKILRQWPRIRVRHHSSSSEDFTDDHEENNNADEDKSPDNDIKSITTDISHVSLEVDDSVNMTPISTPTASPSSDNANKHLLHGPVSVNEHARPSFPPSQSTGSPTSPANERSNLVVKSKSDSCCPACVLL
ncbi:inositol polyphosphate-5-phosphatase A-like [Haliotis rubra]|uniref:inositol polyphosphate-5-phosphatase A-like n=1 Tax=Haliotis rubra TaxID=36100 RepID=UPI001EE62FC0|nr:inositol polyphosphate-5-phosphatase A-like [Haliotis rubra]